MRVNRKIYSVLLAVVLEIRYNWSVGVIVDMSRSASFFLIKPHMTKVQKKCDTYK